MLSDTELAAYLDGLRVPEAGRQYVIESRETAPTRQIGRGSEQSVTGHTFSEINQATRCFESREELAWIRRLERQDESVLEYHAQPTGIQVYRHDVRGRPYYGEFTPDVLVLRSDGIFVTDVKTTENALELTESHPKDWVRHGDGFSFLPAERHFKKIGLDFHISLAEQISRLEARNYALLHSVRSNVPPPDLDTIKMITGRLCRETYLTLGSIRDGYGSPAFEAALWMVDRGLIFSAIKTQSLMDDCAIVAASEELIEFILGTTMAGNRPELSDVDVSLLGNRKAVEHYAEQRGVELQKSRTGRRFRLKIKQADPALSRAAVLMPQYQNRGNRLSKMAPAVKSFMEAFIGEIPIKNFASKNAAYNDYRVNAKKTHPDYPPVTSKTFNQYYKNLDQVGLARLSGGRRAANQVKHSAPAIKRHAKAQRALERVVMDHTLLDIFILIVTSALGVIIRRPWLTVVADEATGFILYYLLTLKQPSRRVFGVVFRNIARRFGRIFEALHSDGGKDMNSVFTRQLVAEYGFTYSVSPAANSRWNGLAESTIGTLNTTFVRDHPANCIEWKERSASRGFRPTDKVVDDLQSLYPKFDEAVAGHNHRILAGSTLSRELHFKKLLEQFPMSGIPIEFDQRFMIATSVDRDDYKVSDRGTFQKLSKHYSPVSDNLVTGPRACEVREDCENPYLIYYLSGTKWKCATAPGFDRFEGLSENARKLDAALTLEGNEARTQLNQLAAETQHAKLVALAENDLENLHKRKSLRSEMKNIKKPLTGDRSSLFNRARRRPVTHDEQED